MGVVAPNALGTDEFRKALFEGKSGIGHLKESQALNFRCELGGVPPITEEYMEKFLPPFYLQKVENQGIIYGCLSGLEAWKDAGLEIDKDKRTKDAGMVFGSGALALDSSIKKSLDLIFGGEPRKLGSRSISQHMNSGAAAYLNQILGLGYKTQSNSSACITGSEALLMGYHEVSSGRARLMICGSTEGKGQIIWSGFDAMRVLCSDSNDRPEFGSRPMSDTSGGFIPSAGSGALVLETLESAQERGATIYAEILGGAQNCGGLRNGGTMTAPNSEALIDCIESAMKEAEISSNEIDLISGHLTSTKADPLEIENWVKALNLSRKDFPLINTPKSMIGHCIAGAGSVESVACILQLHHGFVHKNVNLTEETIHPLIKELVDTQKIPLESEHREIKTVIKSNFGFGDLNCVLVFKKMS